MPTNDEILAALNIIKAVCTERYNGHESCQDCPLGDTRSGECRITKTRPFSWVVGGFEKWKALL